MTSFHLHRRTALRWACGHCALLGAALAQGGANPQLAADAVQAAPGGFSGPAQTRLARPALDTDEGGLWALMDREESRLRRSPLRVRDKPLEDYLRSMVHRLAGEHAADIRVYIVRTPLFNASMAPNGMMQIWTGLLLRMDNEAQLAAILGHELGHYIERHSVERLRDLRSRAAFAQFLGLFGAAGALGQLGMLAGAFAFSREHEMRADRLGMRLMQQAGYDGLQASVVWSNLLTELRAKDGEDAGHGSPMMATHPSPVSRRDDLQQLAGQVTGRTEEAAYARAVDAHRRRWLQDELRRGQWDESLALLNRQLALRATDADLLFARGETHRLRGGELDAEPALRDLDAAARMESAPPQAHRSLGLMLRQRNQVDVARASFQKYLAVAPDAADASLVQQYIAELEP